MPFPEKFKFTANGIDIKASLLLTLTLFCRFAVNSAVRVVMRTGKKEQAGKLVLRGRRGFDAFQGLGNAP